MLADRQVPLDELSWARINYQREPSGSPKNDSHVFGRFVVGASWERLAADYKVLEGGLLPFGILVLLLSPLIAGKIRGTTR